MVDPKLIEEAKLLHKQAESDRIKYETIRKQIDVLEAELREKYKLSQEVDVKQFINDKAESAAEQIVEIMSKIKESKNEISGE